MISDVYTILKNAFSYFLGTMANDSLCSFLIDLSIYVFCLSFVFSLILIPCKAILKLIRKYFLSGVE